jgi:ABC-2 type transport system ATP-binding protein
MPNIIEVNHLVKYFPGSHQPAVRNVSFAVRLGEIFGLLGPAGAGKTTTLCMLAGQLKPAGGTITIAGCDLVRQPNDIRRRCKLVPQKLALCPLLSIQDNLLSYGYLHGLHCKQLRSRVEEALQLVGLYERRHDGVDKNSCGTQRRISLAAALLHRPEILLFDEPTSNLDMESRDNLLRIVTEINRRGLTIVYATCEGEEAARLCHRVALIDRGRIVALDTPRALLDLLRSDFAAPENLDAVFAELTGKHLRG